MHLFTYLLSLYCADFEFVSYLCLLKLAGEIDVMQYFENKYLLQKRTAESPFILSACLCVSPLTLLISLSLCAHVYIYTDM